MTIIQKQKYDYGINTLYKTKKGFYYLVSSMKLSGDRRTSYNIYKSDEYGSMIEVLGEDFPLSEKNLVLNNIKTSEKEGYF